jgi:hypothetical protein
LYVCGLQHPVKGEEDGGGGERVGVWWEEEGKGKGMAEGERKRVKGMGRERKRDETSCRPERYQSQRIKERKHVMLCFLICVRHSMKLAPSLGCWFRMRPHSHMLTHTYTLTRLHTLTHFHHM